MKKLNTKQTIILSIILIILGITIYVIKFNNSNIYNEFKNEENIEELIPYEEEKQSSNDDINDDKDVEQVIVVHITGEVKNWGVFELPVNSRITDAVEAAGGLTDEADISKVNLAYMLEDGMKINIPSLSDKEVVDETYISIDAGSNVIFPTDKDNSVSLKNNLVNINTASQAELETLPGIGPSISLKIVNYRKENGKFKYIDDLKNVNGIGDAKFEQIKNLICV